jgi:tetratricopeptide (TPR) repeat protein
MKHPFQAFSTLLQPVGKCLQLLEQKRTFVSSYLQKAFVSWIKKIFLIFCFVRHGLWTATDAESWTSSASPLSRAMVKHIALRFIETSAGDSSYLHVKFLMDAHLSVAQLFGGDSHVKSHLQLAQNALDAICSMAGDGERWARKTSELRFQYHLACSQILFDGGGEKGEAFEAAKMAKEMLPSLAENGADLGLFCYNCGVREHKAKHMESSIGWIQLSVDSFDRVQNVQNLCRSLRLLAATQLDCRQLDAATKSALLAMELDRNSALSLAMLCRIHAAADDTTALETGLSRLVQAADLTLSAGTDLCQELRTKGALNLCAWTLRQLADRFPNDPSLGLLCVEQLHLAIQSDPTSESALALMNSFASSHHSGTVRLSAPVCAEMVRICFDLGVKSRPRPNVASSWIGFAVSLASSSSMESEGRAQLYRLLASIHLDASELVPALTSAKSAVQLCPLVAAGHYLLARCRMQKDPSETAASLAQLAACKDYSPNMMFNLASLAQSVGLTSVMIDALERFVSSVDMSPANHRDFVAASRALVRALSSSSDYSQAARIITVIFSKCKEAGGWNVVYPDLPQHLEGEWAAKAIYNLAGSALTAKNLSYASVLFDMASVVCAFQSETVPLVLPSRRLALTCFLDAATACSPEQIEHANAHLKALRLSGTMDKDELLLLEFRTSLLDPAVSVSDVAVYVSRYSAMSTSPFLFERMASACVQQKSKGLAEPAIHALAVSFRLHAAARPLNTERAATVVRNLVSLSILTGSDLLQVSQFRDIVELVKAEPSWPILDRQYLAIEIWNLGAREWRRSKLQVAESWCSLAMGLSKYCGHNWPSMLEMKTAYNQLLVTLASGAIDSSC